MKPTDIRVRHVALEMRLEPLRTPLKLSTGAIQALTYAAVRVTVENRAGQVASGRGGMFLSPIWAFPAADVPPAARERAMQQLTQHLVDRLAGWKEFADPIRLGHEIDSEVDHHRMTVRAEQGLPEPLTRLAALNCLAPLDAALHDAWGLAAGRSAYDMYTADFLGEDLAAYLGPELAGQYPADFLVSPRQALAVQHVVGLADPPEAVAAWIERDQVRWFKLKMTGADLQADLDRIIEVHRTAAQTRERLALDPEVAMEVDPNEACEGPEFMVELLERLRLASPAAYAALRYIEQPTARDLSRYPFTLHTVSRLKPVLADESLDTLENLARLEPLGWSGVALKTAKGQTHALLTYCWARRHGLFIAVQDLTNPGLAFIQSASLAARLALSADCIEYNARQYVPDACADERAVLPEVFVVRGGEIAIPPGSRPGLYLTSGHPGSR